MLFIKNFLLLLVFTVFGQTLFSQEPNRVKDTVDIYIGGREMYSSITLTLLSDSTYRYDSWMKSGFTIQDSGIWKIFDSCIVLNSITTETISKIRLTKKEQRKEDKLFRVEKEYLPRFETDTFTINGNKLMLYNQEIDDEEDGSFQKRYLTLYRK